MNILITEKGEVIFGYRGNKGRSQEDNFVFGFYISDNPCEYCQLDEKCEELRSPHPGYKTMWDFCTEFPGDNTPGYIIIDSNKLRPLDSYLIKYKIND